MHGKHSDLAPQLQWAPLEIITNSQCGRYYNLVMAGTIICAQGQRKESVCYGDSGGPLILRSDNSTLIGVTSFGHNSGCNLGIPQGFTRITSFKRWIKQITGIDSD